MSDDIYQEIIMEHFKRPRNFGPLPERTHRGSAVNTVCGDAVDLHLLVRDGAIKEVGADVTGCAICKASASMMTEAIKGLTTEAAEKVLSDVWSLIDAVGEIPDVEGELMALAQLREYPMRRQCGLLSWKALKEALRSGCTTTQDP